MTETIKKFEIYKVDHSTFGGTICASDFDRKTSLSDVASRIESNKKFDEQCRKNILNKQNYGGNKNA